MLQQYARLMQQVGLAVSIFAATSLRAVYVFAVTSTAASDFGQQRRFTEQQYARLMQQVGLATESLTATATDEERQHDRLMLQQ